MKVLCVIDMQNDFIDGSLGSVEAQNIVPNVVHKVKEFRGVIFYTLDTHDSNYKETLEGKLLPVEHCIYDTKGWEVHPEVKAELDSSDIALLVTKKSFGSLGLPERIKALEKATTEVESIEICGLCTDICVISNALILRAAFPDVPIILDASCCAGVTPEKHKAALEVMKSCQIDVVNDKSLDS
jgi:nicotinamidase-related amidase